MPRFAVYFVPETDDEFYRLGSQLMRYDVRARKPIHMSSALRDRLPTFDTAWAAKARPFGFHLTLCDAIDCTWAAVALVERELEALIGCFDPLHPFTLQQLPDHPIAVWGQPGDAIMALRYEPNDYMVMLTTLLVARLNPLGTGSGYLQRYLLGEDNHPPHRAQLTRLFYSPWVLDNWVPHFTLLNPFRGDEREAVAQALASAFAPFATLTIRSVCLMVQAREDSHWLIYREFWRPTP
ncbi:MAG TPA: DUF1045 domain-containing protein [Ktedonobacterales bacterium]|jgi:hypothetical protein